MHLWYTLLINLVHRNDMFWFHSCSKFQCYEPLFDLVCASAFDNESERFKNWLTCFPLNISKCWWTEKMNLQLQWNRATFICPLRKATRPTSCWLDNCGLSMKGWNIAWGRIFIPSPYPCYQTSPLIVWSPQTSWNVEYSQAERPLWIMDINLFYRACLWDSFIVWLADFYPEDESGSGKACWGPEKERAVKRSITKASVGMGDGAGAEQ